MDTIFPILAMMSVLGLGSCYGLAEIPASRETEASPSAAASRLAPDTCPLPREWQQALADCAGMQWRRAKGDGAFATVPVAAEDAAVVKDLLLYKTHAAQARSRHAPSRRFEEGLRLQLQNTVGKTVCSIPMCYIAPESDACDGVFGYSRYAMSNEDYTTLYRIMLRPEIIAEAPLGQAPERRELIRLYNRGKDLYNAQTHVMTYRPVSGKEISTRRPRGSALPTGGPVIAPERTYGIARVIKPRNEPVLGGGDLQVIYDPETGAILSGGKAR